MNLEPLNSCGVQKPEIISVGSPPPPVAQIRGSVTAVGWVGGKRRNTDEVVLCWSSWCLNFGVSEALVDRNLEKIDQNFKYSEFHEI